MDRLSTRAEGEEGGTPFREGAHSRHNEDEPSASRVSIRKKCHVVATNSPNYNVNREKHFKFLKRMRQKETRDKAKTNLA